jgi:hypothetical protein
MTPAELDRLLHAQMKPGEHGARNCPKCKLGYMAYQQFGSSSGYVCVDCAWLEFSHPPWPDRGPAGEAGQVGWMGGEYDR